MSARSVSPLGARALPRLAREVRVGTSAPHGQATPSRHPIDASPRPRWRPAARRAEASSQVRQFFLPHEKRPPSHFFLFCCVLEAAKARARALGIENSAQSLEVCWSIKRQFRFNGCRHRLLACTAGHHGQPAAAAPNQQRG